MNREKLLLQFHTHSISGSGSGSGNSGLQSTTTTAAAPLSRVSLTQKKTKQDLLQICIMNFSVRQMACVCGKLSLGRFISLAGKMAELCPVLCAN